MLFKIVSVLAMLLLSGSVSAVDLDRSNSSSVNIMVPTDYPKIQDAIRNANPGDIIQVLSGIYKETLFIDKTLTLVGESGETTILDGNGGLTILQANSTSLTIEGFTMINCTNGIILENCSRSTISKNNIHASVKGIWLHYSNSNTVSDNTVSHSIWRSGIVLCGGSSNNVITRNTLKENVIGIALTGTGNLIYHNNFINNQNQTDMISSFYNSWNNTCEGNYWSDYNGTDFDAYGIGSIPYTVDPNNQDSYPLKSPYMVGDINHDAKVDILDISMIAKAFWAVPGDGRWNLHADIDGNNQIDIADISEPARSFGKEWKDPL